ncbi:MAG: hypothetical protein FWE90_11575, partial [Defluviitaleaceae bacterium]|nr:hypothetical protein [Defluviitaleaceae bacterium]
LSYQWQRAPGVTGGDFENISGATNATYTPSTTEAGINRYRVIITNTNTAVNGTQTAAATSDIITVTVVPLVNAATPNITAQPQSIEAWVGDTVTLTVTAISPDSGSLSYQWQRAPGSTGGEFQNILGATSVTYNPDTTEANVNRYRVIVTNTNTAVNGTQTATATSDIVTVNLNNITITTEDQLHHANNYMTGDMTITVDITLTQNLTLVNGRTLTIARGVTLNVSAGILLINEGTLKIEEYDPIHDDEGVLRIYPNGAVWNGEGSFHPHHNRVVFAGDGAIFRDSGGGIYIGDHFGDEIADQSIPEWVCAYWGDDEIGVNNILNLILITYERLWDAILDAIEEGGTITLLGCEYGEEIGLGADNDVIDLTGLILRGVEGVTLALTDVIIGTGFFEPDGMTEVTIGMPIDDRVFAWSTANGGRWVAL